MADDDFDVLAPDPLLTSSEGDEALLLGVGIEAASRRRHWMGIAAGVGVGSAAVAAALLFWGDKKRAPPNTMRTSRRPQSRTKPVRHSKSTSGDEPAN